jgi:hypothetical protein
MAGEILHVIIILIKIRFMADLFGELRQDTILAKA